MNKGSVCTLLQHAENEWQPSFLRPCLSFLIGPELTQQVRLVPGFPTSPLQCYETPILPAIPGFWGWSSSLMLATRGLSRLLSFSPQPLLLVYPWHHTGPSRRQVSQTSLTSREKSDLFIDCQSPSVSALPNCRLCRKFLWAQTREPPGLLKISDPGYFVSRLHELVFQF